MKSMSKLLLSILFILGLSIQGFSQDRYFTQFYANPLELNPALTGAIDGSYRITAGYRDQWSGFVNSPYLTMGAYGDFRFDLGRKQKRSGDFVGAGLSFISDRTAFFNINSNQISLSAAYHKNLSSATKSFLSAGFSFGLIQRSLNYENLEFGDQFNGLNGYTFGTNEIFPENNFAHGDLSVGLNYSISPTKFSSLFFGGAIQHLTEPNIGYYNRSTDLAELYEEVPLDRKYIIAMSAEIGFNELYSILPRIMYQTQGPLSMLNLGGAFKFDLNLHNQNALQVGGGVRMAQKESGFGPVAAYVMTGFVLENLLIGLSYDFNLDDLVNERFGQNSFEISISYIGDYGNSDVFCPTF